MTQSFAPPGSRMLRSSGSCADRARRLWNRFHCRLCVAVAGLVAALTVQTSFAGQRLGRPLRENSGIAVSSWIPEHFLAIADSGNAPALFEVDDRGNVISRYRLYWTKNYDWEDIASNGKDRIYVADIGNNFSARSVLTIYEVLLSPSRAGQRLEVRRGQTIRFRYAEPSITFLSDYDAESMIWLGGHLYIFTKRRSDTRSEVFRLSVPERHTRSRAQDIVDATSIGYVNLASEYEFIYFGRMATAAELGPNAQYLAILTYDQVLIFQAPWLSPWEPGAYKSAAETDARILELLGSEPVRISLPLPASGQCEGLTWRGYEIFISNEAGRIWKLPYSIETDR